MKEKPSSSSSPPPYSPTTDYLEIHRENRAKNEEEMKENPSTGSPSSPSSSTPPPPYSLPTDYLEIHGEALAKNEEEMKENPSNRSLSSPSSSSPPPPYSLPIDMIIDILSRLPVKSLCKFKCVSKKFLESITDPHFISRHRELSLSNPNILLVKTTLTEKRTKVDFCVLSSDGIRKNHEFSLYLNDEDTYIEMLPSKWDLVCFICNSGFHVCNPSTQVMVELPESRYSPRAAESAGMGFIKERDEYVFVHLFMIDLDVNCDIGCKVLRLRDGVDCSWKVVDGDCPYEVLGWGVLVENSFYWKLSEVGVNREIIMSFDLETEEFDALSAPELWFDPSNNPLSQSWYVVELGGRLCLLNNETKTCKPTMDIWVLKDIENHEWVRKYSIEMDVYNCKLNSIVPLDCCDGKILMHANRESLDYYDAKTKCIRRMDSRIAGKWNWLSLYTESFFSFHQIDIDAVCQILLSLSKSCLVS